MPNIDLNILNQRQTPAFYADTFANRPPAGFVGRIFVSTNTFEFFRDNGTTYDLIGGPGTSTITGSGANGQVSFWNGASTITGSNDLFYDAVNGHLGIGTITPGTALDVHHDQSTVLQLQQTVATNDNRITFINTGAALWRIGSFYNAGANDFGIFDVVGAAQPVTIKKTTGQVLIGTSTVGSGKLVVSSAIGDNGVQIVGATAPSLRIDNAESGPTKRAGFGIATATNNFIQGSADRDFCIFNGSTTASPILFGIYDAAAVNVQEAARISAARNFIINSVTDNGAKFQVSGTTTISTSLFIGTNNSVTPYTAAFKVGASGSTFFVRDNGAEAYFIGPSIGYFGTATAGSSLYLVSNNGSTTMVLSGSNNVLIGTTTDAGQKLQVFGTVQFDASNTANLRLKGTSITGFDLQCDSAGAYIVNRDNTDIYFFTNNVQKMRIKNNTINMSSIPTSASGLVSGDLYQTAGVLNIVP